MRSYSLKMEQQVPNSKLLSPSGKWLHITVLLSHTGYTLTLGYQNTPPLDLDVILGQSLQEAEARHKHSLIAVAKPCLKAL